MPVWNPWHGCSKVSPGCLNCYVYREDVKYGRDPAVVEKNSTFALPVQTNKKGEYKLKPSGDYVYTCFTSDFFHPAADTWRKEAWQFMKTRADLRFFFITKRIDRFFVSLPDDWGSGYENVTICCTCENQELADYRLPIFASLPVLHKRIVNEPLLGAIDLSEYLRLQKPDGTPMIEQVLCGGESGSGARLCKYDWVLSIREQCRKHRIPFYFKQTGALFEKDGKVYRIPRRLQLSQARKAGINFD